MAKESIKKLKASIKNQINLQNMGVLGENHLRNPKN
jgi:hypothetical protein